MRERLAELARAVADLAPDEVWHGVLREAAADLAAAGCSAPARDVGVDDALARIVDRFGLSGFDRDLLLLAGIAEEHEAFAHLFASYHPEGEARPTVAVCARALQLRPSDTAALREALEAGPLARHGILAVEAAPPLPARTLRLAPGLWRLCAGARGWPPHLPTVPLAPLPTAFVDEPLRRWATAVDATRPALLPVVGGERRRPLDVAALVATALAGAGRGVVAVTAENAVAHGPAIGTAAVALDLVPVVVGAPSTPPLPEHPGPVVLCADRIVGTGADLRAVLPHELPRPTVSEEAAMWHQLLPELDGGVRRLAGTLRMGPTTARLVAADARRTIGADGGALDTDAVLRAARVRSGASLPDAVRFVAPRASFDDLVLAERSTRLLRAAVDRVRHQTTVLDDWDFATTVRGGRGVRLLLSGPPGTGKTLAAEVMAHELGLDMLVVDLSALVSKWIGETEKHVSEVFDAAERTRAVLVFDEAESVFGQRTSGSDAQSRWANVETAHVLARTESFEGMLVLTTNLRSAIDEAFTRRLDVVVETEEPGPDERAALWRLHLPAAAPVADDLDPVVLGERYPVTGAAIRNAALAAAFAAAGGGTPITTERVVAALRHEYDKAGRSFPGPPRSVRVLAPTTA